MRGNEERQEAVFSYVSLEQGGVAAGEAAQPATSGVAVSDRRHCLQPSPDETVGSGHGVKARAGHGLHPEPAETGSKIPTGEGSNAIYPTTGGLSESEFFSTLFSR